MADFRNTTNEFKSTWQREVDFEEEVSALRTGELPDAAPLPVPRAEPASDSTNSIAPPSIKPVQTDLFDNVPVEAKTEAEKDDDTSADDDLSDKRNWL